MIGPHVSPADASAMIDRQRAIDSVVDQDEGVRVAREAYVARLDEYDAARRAFEAASVGLAEATRLALAGTRS